MQVDAVVEVDGVVQVDGILRNVLELTSSKKTRSSSNTCRHFRLGTCKVSSSESTSLLLAGLHEIMK